MKSIINKYISIIFFLLLLCLVINNNTLNRHNSSASSALNMDITTQSLDNELIYLMPGNYTYIIDTLKNITFMGNGHGVYLSLKASEITNSTFINLNLILTQSRYGGISNNTFRYVNFTDIVEPFYGSDNSFHDCNFTSTFKERFLISYLNDFYIVRIGNSIEGRFQLQGSGNRIVNCTFISNHEIHTSIYPPESGSRSIHPASLSLELFDCHNTFIINSTFIRYVNISFDDDIPPEDYHRILPHSISASAISVTTYTNNYYRPNEIIVIEGNTFINYYCGISFHYKCFFQDEWWTDKDWLLSIPAPAMQFIIIRYNNFIDTELGVYVFLIHSFNISLDSYDLFMKEYYSFFINHSSQHYIINASHNYWNDSSGPFNIDFNPSGMGSYISDNISFEPWLTDFFEYFPPYMPAKPVFTTENLSIYHGEFNINWYHSENALLYVLYENGIEIYTGPNPFYSVTKLSSGVYSYNVKAWNYYGISTLSNSIQIIVKIPTPDTPEITTINSTSITGNYKINWTSSSYADYYILYENGLKIYNTTELFKEFTEKANGTYNYTVQAFNVNGSSELSNVVVVTVEIPPWPVTEEPLLPETPEIITVNFTSSVSNYKLNWTSTENTDYYILYENNTVIYNGTNAYYNITDKENGQYHYRVMAVNDNGTSELSNEVVITVEIITEVKEEEKKTPFISIFSMAFLFVAVALKGKRRI